MDIVEFVEKVLDTLRDMDNGIDVICNLDAKAVVEKMEVVNIIPIPKGATNGEVIKAMFPNAKVNVTKYSYAVEVKLPYHTKYDTGLLFNKYFWNAPYNKEVEDDN